MSPMTKKILMIGGVAVVGLIVYKKMMGSKPAATATKKIASPTTAAKMAAIRMPLVELKTAATAKMAGDDLLAELGLEEQLGSLGGAYR